MLGRPVSLLGTVVRGQAIGKHMGYPTANLDLHHEARPPTGIYAVRVVHAGRTYPALASIGTRPTFAPASEEVLIEIHLLDFEGNLYGSELEVFFFAKLRDQERLPSTAALIEQIRRDEAAATAALAPEQTGDPPIGS